MANLGKCKVIVGFIPETKHRAVSVIRGKNQGANHEAFLAVRQILEGQSHASLIVGKLDH